ncbi:MAG: hypothetical protein ACRCVJ_10015 [Clostridium sp.]|uniref:hypothetical protein n=1 Tax=Clostridium sp. TaxID=1506 RepID=UPI003F3E2850
MSTHKNDNRIVLVKDIFEINNDIKLFSNITDKCMVPKFNKGLLMKDGNEYIQDKFKHEQNLILKENNKHVLVAGCAHNGIINIMKKAEGLIGVKIDVVLSGMHLYNPVLKINESTLFIESLSKCLLNMECRIYTFHCTGIKAFNILRGIIGDNIEYLATGQGVEI